MLKTNENPENHELHTLSHSHGLVPNDSWIGASLWPGGWGPLPYNIMHLKVTVVVIWHYINKMELYLFIYLFILFFSWQSFNVQICCPELFLFQM